MAWRNWRRTGIATIAIVLGLLLLIFMDGLYGGYDEAVFANAVRLYGGNLQIHAPGFRDRAHRLPLLPLKYADYIDANRSTMRRLDGLWDGLEKAGLRPDRLQLEWCSAAEGARWQIIMEEAENKRQGVTQDEIVKTRSVLVEARVPSPRNPRPKDEGQEATFVCMLCGNEWGVKYEVNTERICPSCRSNSVRWLKVH